MAKKLIYRILFSIVTFFALTFFVFLLSNMMRGNAVDAMIAQNPHMTTATYNALLHDRGLDLPIPLRYWRWLTMFMSGDMGNCTQLGRPVSDVLATKIGPTLILNFTSLIIAIIVSIPLGVMAAYKPYSAWDNVSSFLSFVGSALPGFLLALLGVFIFSVKLHWLPTQGMYDPTKPATVGNLIVHMILPASIGAFQMIGSILKQTRGAVLEVLNEDYIKTARSKGLTERKVVINHALRNALIPIVTTIGLEIPYLVSGSVVIETIFSWPGMGSFLITSINARDFDPIMAISVIICTIVLITNIAIDVIYMFIDPTMAKE